MKKLAKVFLLTILVIAKLNLIAQNSVDDCFMIMKSRLEEEFDDMKVSLDKTFLVTKSEVNSNILGEITYTNKIALNKIRDVYFKVQIGKDGVKHTQIHLVLSGEFYFRYFESKQDGKGPILTSKTYKDYWIFFDLPDEEAKKIVKALKFLAKAKGAKLINL